MNADSNLITRWATDDCGRLGSLYDVCRDCVLGQLNVSDSSKSRQHVNSTTYHIAKNDSKKNLNLLKNLGIENDLQLSMLLNLSPKPKAGIASILDYRHSTEETTYILTFRYINDEELVDDINQVQTLEINATHFITGVSWGFYAIVILQLPESQETASKYDDIFEKMQNNVEWNDDDDLLREVTVVKVYSNVFELSILTELPNICRRINHLKDSNVNYPMMYTLHPVSNLNAKFITLTPVFTDIMLKQISRIFHKTEDLEQLVCNYHVKEQFYEIYQQWLDVKKRYTNELERLAKQLIACRSDQLGLNELKGALDDPALNQLEKDMIEFKQRLKHTEVSCKINKEIIILVLGETGVGKSTFINALVNYLTHDSLQTAELHRPVILIPVSFVMTAGNDFQEYTVTLEDTHQSDDENFNLFGQSVTQHCRSYILQLKNNNHIGMKIRLVDTPGFGDTRGTAQDDRNMQHILEYINRLSQINAICYLFKSNGGHIHNFFQSSIMQLLDQLGSDAGRNIIFCCTNARGTFFTPGNIAPILKTTLSSLPIQTILFYKENTFCFDSESFRYLAAIQQHVPITTTDKHEYELSWSMSVKESNRLLDYIGDKLPIYRMQEDRQLIKNIQFEILHLIRPMLEAIRNILRNIILRMLSNANQSIALRPKPLFRLATQCQSCNPIPIRCGPFWILPDIGHEIQDKCLTCVCASDQHSPIEYMLEYEYVESSHTLDEYNEMIQPLFDASVEFTYFTKSDSFFLGFNRLITEEKAITEKVQPNDFNLQLVQQLTNILQDYEKRIETMKHQEWNGDLSTVKNHPMVREQIEVIQQSQERMMHIFEYQC